EELERDRLAVSRRLHVRQGRLEAERLVEKLTAPAGRADRGEDREATAADHQHQPVAALGDLLTERVDLRLDLGEGSFGLGLLVEDGAERARVGNEIVEERTAERQVDGGSHTR